MSTHKSSKRSVRMRVVSVKGRCLGTHGLGIILPIDCHETPSPSQKSK